MSTHSLFDPILDSRFFNRFRIDLHYIFISDMDLLDIFNILDGHFLNLFLFLFFLFGPNLSHFSLTQGCTIERIRLDWCWKRLGRFFLLFNFFRFSNLSSNYDLLGFVGNSNESKGLQQDCTDETPLSILGHLTNPCQIECKGP